MASSKSDANVDEKRYREAVDASPVSAALSHDELDGVPKSLVNDSLDMARLGKKQELTRNFRFLSTVGFASVFSCTWEYVLLSTLTALINGGYSGAIYEYIWVFFG